MSLGISSLYRFILIFYLFFTPLYAKIPRLGLEFTLIKKGVTDNNTLLIFGGIQGDEPGGFNAAALVCTHYKILKGSVWVVPNLNFESIILRSRGPYGDMNRKFAYLDKNDPEYNIIQKVKKIIRSKEVALVLNLHDGSGYYRPKYYNWSFSPNRWGQSVIIDQEKLNIDKYGDLKNIAQKVTKHINNFLIKAHHRYHLKNTNTKMGDKEMEKALTYYAIKHNKAAFANEASKNLPTYLRVYYHLLAIEKYMDIMNIKYSRDFILTPEVVKNVLENDIEVAFYDSRIKLPLKGVRKRLRYFPLDKNKIEIHPNNPLIALVKFGKNYSLFYGNRKLTNISPQYFKFHDKKERVKLEVDGKKVDVNFGDIVKVKKYFKTLPVKDYRVNVIGFVSKSKNEVNYKIDKKKIKKRFSIDKDGKVYRVEYYKKDKFAGMVLVEFNSLTKIALNNKK